VGVVRRKCWSRNHVGERTERARRRKGLLTQIPLFLKQCFGSALTLSGSGSSFENECGSGSWIYVKNKNFVKVKKIMLNFNENKVTKIYIPITLFLYFLCVFIFILALFRPPGSSDQLNADPCGSGSETLV
jgi:hypothetical protein